MIAALGRKKRLFDKPLGDALVVFDFDGTLAPITGDRGRAEMRRSTKLLLHQLATRHPVVILSGRARPDLLARLGKTPVKAAIGNHGAQVDDKKPSKVVAATIVKWRDGLRGELADLAGVEVEDKAFSLAVHYRRARSTSAPRRIAAAIAKVAPSADVTPGKRVINVGIPGHDKASALSRLVKRFPGRPILFVGDDDNDERAFAARLPGVVSVRVGPVRRSHADYYLPEQARIDDLLRALIELPTMPRKPIKLRTRRRTG